MPKFIKFLNESEKSMVIINTEVIESIYFVRETLSIVMCVKYVERRPIDFTYKTEESFKINCDEIMRQLEV